MSLPEGNSPMIKMIGIAAVVFSCCSLGLLKSADMKKRLLQLREWQRLVMLLEHEITFNVTLPEAIRTVGSRAKEPFAGFLKSLCAQLDSYTGRSFSEIFVREATKHLEDSSLQSSDIRELCQLADMMGNASKQMQKQILEHYLEELALVIHNLQAQLPEKQRLFRSLGILGGAFLGILLL